MSLTGTFSSWAGFSIDSRPTLTIGDHWEWYNLACQFGAVGSLNPYALQNFEARLGQNLTALTDLDGGTAGSLRFPKRQQVGDETVSLSMTTFAPIPSSLLGNYADAIGESLQFQMVATNDNGNVLTLTISNLSAGENGISLTPDSSPVGYTYNFEARMNLANTWSLVLT